MRWRKALRARVGLLALLGWTSGTPARLDGAVLRNDSVEDFSEVFIQVGFLANERAAAWLTSTCDGNLTAVQVLWLSLTGGAGQTLGNAITVSQAGSFPDPGAELAQLVGPALNDGFFNEYPVVPSIPVSLGQTLVVDFEFFEAPPFTGPSVVTDTDGCQPSKNAIFALPHQVWFDACVLGVGGDFAIRAIVDCPDIVFKDGFQSGDTSAWSSSVP